MPLSYELALKLKEAGLNLEHHYDEHSCVRCDKPHFALCEPNLEELIEACGDRFGKLERHGKYWQTTYPLISAINLPNRPEKGSTPIEAVANLYIELNKK